MKNQNFGSENLYELLGLHPKAPEFVVHAAYRAMMKQNHPDLGGSDSIPARLNQAKEILLDPEKRRKYDEYLRQAAEKQIGNYQVLEQIGQGAFGITLKAKHTKIGGLACLKQNIYISSGDIAIITKEAELLWDIHHHSLPTLRDFFQLDDGSCVMAMSYVSGASLDAIVEKRRKEGETLEPEHACWMTQRLLNALNYLHFHGIIHGDVKPNNIIIVPKEHNAILVDFGLATLRPIKGIKPQGYTEVFAPPEILELKTPLPQSDLFSLGKTMIYALGGNPAYNSYPGSVPKNIQDFFNRLVEKNPLKRPVWKDVDLVTEISKIRMDTFGRKSSNLELKI
jgi:serine/threonine protein kinase